MQEHIPVIDSHQHFWRLSRGDYDWLTPDLKPIYRDFLPNDLVPLMVENRVGRSILVQASPTVEETQYLLSLAAEYNFIAGVVGWIDMGTKNAPQELEMLAQNKALCGIRPMIQDIFPHDWMLGEDLVPTFEKLSALQLGFDALVRPVHLDSLLLLAKRFPDLRIVIDHAAKPDIASGDFSQWSGKITQFAMLENVYCKISGFLTEMGQDRQPALLQPYISCLVEVFGPARLMWGSDWPVLNLVSDYSEWFDIAGGLLKGLQKDDKSQIFSGTASQFYQLDR